ncbi:MAG TPA: co-chaperone GroES [Rhabdochlamydiaceae bacterium]|nr:co-chaperone GroES [Rhabdochlamydiaceae bacterium]
MAQVTEKKTTIKPLGNRVLAQRVEQEQPIKGGIILPDSAKKKPETAKVIAVGDGMQTPEGKTVPIPVSIGDTILMDKYSGQEVTIDDEEYIILKADDIIAIVNQRRT